LKRIRIFWPVVKWKHSILHAFTWQLRWRGITKICLFCGQGLSLSLSHTHTYIGTNVHIHTWYIVHAHTWWARRSLRAPQPEIWPTRSLRHHIKLRSHYVYVLMHVCGE
jgi:hypothetical protein